MSHWDPHLDLMRLLEALGSEIVAATELEARQACAEDPWSMARAKLLWSAWPELQVEGGSSVTMTVKEVRELIEAVTGDSGDPEIAVEKVHIELRGSRHLQGAVEPGSRFCYKQH
jgi:hypothetical protein